MNLLKARKILCLQENYSSEQLKNNYKKLLFKHHPDKNGNLKKFLELQNAYKFLTNNTEKTYIYTTIQKKTFLKRIFSLYTKILKGDF